jgi:cell division protein FtsW
MVLAFAGLVVMLVAAHIPYRVWNWGRGLPAVAILLVTLVLVFLVFVPGVGVEARGARRWIQIGASPRLQPSELLKLAVPLFLAVWMTTLADVRNFRRGFFPAVLLVGVAAGLVGLEDFGTAALLTLVAGAMLIVGGAKWWHVILPIVPATLAFCGLIVSRPHRVERLIAFQNIWKDPENTGYQAIQSLCSIASGGWLGQGLGAGVVKGHLPEGHNDFIFAVICEEFGVLGAATVIALMIAFLWQARKVVVRCGDPMGRLLAFGLALTIGIQAAINIAVVTVTVPTKGISLPLVSAGGSGALALGAMVGMLANIARTCPVRAPAEKPLAG